MKTRVRNLAFALILLVAIGAGGASFAQLAPVVVTGAATAAGATNATLNGSVNPNGTETLVYFEYGTTPSFGLRTPTQNIGTTAVPVAVTAGVNGLQGGTLYYFRLIAQNQGTFGFLPGQTLTFTTPPVAAGNAPSVSTNAASDIGANGAMLNAYISPTEQTAVVWFEYGPRGDVLPFTTPQTPVADVNYYRTTNASPFVRVRVSDLVPGSAYAFRAVIRAANGAVNYGQTLGFYTLGGTTAAAPYSGNAYYGNTGAVTYTSYYYHDTASAPQTGGPLYVFVPTAVPVRTSAPSAAQVASSRPSYYYRAPIASLPVARAMTGEGSGAKQTAAVSETVSASAVRTVGKVVYGVLFFVLLYLILLYAWRIFAYAP